MRPNGRERGLDNRAGILIATEDDKSGFRVAPSYVAEELVHRVRKLLLAVPNLTLGDEEIGTPIPDEYVGMSDTIEGLAGRRALVLAV